MRLLKYRPAISVVVLVYLISGLGILGWPAKTFASINYGHLIDDSVFENVGSKSASQTDSWLNSNYPSGCISGSFRAPDPLGWSSSQNKMLFGSNVTAGKVIFDASQIYHVNPNVLLATLQKEQSAVSGGAGCHPNSPDPNSATNMTDKCGPGTRKCTVACIYAGGCLNIAMGYGCPSYCDVRYEGFSKQVIWAANTLRFAEVRSEGILTGYTGHDPGDEDLHYSGPMTRGYRRRSASEPNIYYDGTYTPKDASAINVATGATAALYNYTPFESGNHNFYNIFSDWFGSPIGPCAATGNVSGQPSGRQFMADQYKKSGADNLAFTRLNNTGSACTEAHVWSTGYKGWTAALQTALPAVDPAKGMLLTGNFASDHRDELVYAKFASGSGNVEIHTLSSSYKSWVSRVSTNLSNISSSTGTFVSGDINGDGQDDLLYINYHGGSDQVEVYRWAANYHSWASHGVTNLSAITSSAGTFVAGDMNGDGKDELMYVKYSGASDQVEVYTWAPGYRSWTSHKITNLSAITSSAGTFVAGDMNGDGKDELMYVKYGGASGQVEVYTWAPGYRSWTSHKITSLASFDPTT